MKLIKLELYKLFKRKDAYVVYAMLLIPLLYSAGFSANVQNITYNGGNNMTALKFAGDMFAFGFYIFIFLFASALSMTSSCRGEIEDGSITLLINRVGCRKQIFIFKIFAHFMYIMIFTIIFVAFSTICYFLFLNDTEIASGAFFSGEDLNTLITIVSLVFIYFFAITLGGLLSIKFNIFASAGIFIVIWAVLLYMKEFNVNILSPIYHITNVIENPGIDLLETYLLNVSAYIVINTAIGTLIFERSDLD